MITIIYGLTFECTFDFEPAEPETETDPGWPAMYTLTGAWLNGVDIGKLLDQKIVQELERRAAWG